MKPEHTNSYHEDLKQLMDEFVHFAYDIISNFPKEEQFGIISQLRRASLSIILNYIEGYARRRKNVLKNFLEISYGSLKESKYLLYFYYKRAFINLHLYNKGLHMNERIGRMVWGILNKL